MLTRIRIEVEEETAAACVDALWKYEHALVQQEVRRYRHLWPVEEGEGEEYPTAEHPWSDDMTERLFANEELGREVTEEVIEFDESLPGYRGRRVVRYVRIDMRKEPGPFSVSFTLTGPWAVDSSQHSG